MRVYLRDLLLKPRLSKRLLLCYPRRCLSHLRTTGLSNCIDLDGCIAEEVLTAYETTRLSNLKFGDLKTAYD